MNATLRTLLTWRDIPMTAQGIKLHTRLLAKYESKHGALSSSVSTAIKRKYAYILRRETKRRPASSAAASAAAAATEKMRAAAAYRLVKWIGRTGKKIPATEEGIVRHAAAVTTYEAKYGKRSSADARTTAGIYANIRKARAAETARALATKEARARRAAADAAKKKAKRQPTAHEIERAKKNDASTRAWMAKQDAEEAAKRKRAVKLYRSQLAELARHKASYERWKHLPRYKSIFARNVANIGARIQRIVVMNPGVRAWSDEAKD